MNPQNGILNAFYRWTNNLIPYKMAASFSKSHCKFFIELKTKVTLLLLFTAADQKAIIKSGLDDIASKTCIKFVERTTQANYVDITNDNSGCWSYIGCVRGAQTLNLQSNVGCVTKGVTMHEMLHAIGFFHSHSDSSRDNYVKINYDNVQSGKEYNFAMYTNSYVSAFGQEYDYKSILHYGAYAFTKNGLKTIEAKGSESIGQRSYLSELDIKKVNIMYNCEAFL